MKKILQSIYYGILKLIRGAGYRNFGTRSVVRKPIRILGKKNISVGERVFVLDGLRMEAVTQWDGKTYTPKISIGDDVSIGQFCHMTCANELLIGRGCSILPNVLITDIEHEYIAGKSIRETGIAVGSVVIGENVTIGMGARILGHKGIRIGNNCVIGTNAVVTQDIEDGKVVAGIPARVIGEVE